MPPAPCQRDDTVDGLEATAMHLASARYSQHLRTGDLAASGVLDGAALAVFAALAVGVVTLGSMIWIMA